MLVLRSNPASPFGRKVKMAAHILGLFDRFEVVAADTTSATDPIRALNPLGKIPALELGDGTTLFDSRVIVEYLDWLAGGGRIIPAPSPARFAALRLAALGDGLAEAALLQVYEARYRDEAQRSPQWLDLQAGKVARALAAVEAEPPSEQLEVGEIAVASALGYLDLRFEGAWRTDHPRLVAWLDAFRAATPAYDKTASH